MHDNLHIKKHHHHTNNLISIFIFFQLKFSCVDFILVDNVKSYIYSYGS
jgi:hypothetical protein